MNKCNNTNPRLFFSLRLFTVQHIALHSRFHNLYIFTYLFVKSFRALKYLFSSFLKHTKEGDLFFHLQQRIWCLPKMIIILIRSDSFVGTFSYKNKTLSLSKGVMLSILLFSQSNKVCQNFDTTRQEYKRCSIVSHSS